MELNRFLILLIAISFVGCGVEEDNPNILQTEINSNGKSMQVSVELEPSVSIIDTVIKLNKEKYLLSFLTKKNSEKEVQITLHSTEEQLIFSKVFNSESFIKHVNTTVFKDIEIKDVTYIGVASDGSAKVVFVFKVGPRGTKYEYIELVTRIDLNSDIEISQDGFE